MNENIKVTDEERYLPISSITVRKIREVTGLESLKKNFKKELKKIEIDDLSSHNLSLPSLLSLIQKMRPNTIVLGNGSNFLVVEADIMLREYIAMRADKMIGQGSMIQCQEAMVKQIQKEFGDKFDALKPEEIDDTWLKTFSNMHFGVPRMHRIINIK